MLFFALFSLLNGVMNISLGLFVFLKNAKKPENVLFFLFTVAIFVWNIGYSLMYFSDDLGIALAYAKFGTLGIIFIPFFANLFVLKILGKKERTSNFILLFCSFILVFMLLRNNFYSGIAEYYWGKYPTANTFNLLNVVFYVYLFSKIVFQLWSSREKSMGMEKRRLSYLLTAFGIGFFGFIDWLPNYFPGFYPMAFLLSSTWLVIIAYAIVKHRLMDIEVIIRKSIIYSALIFCLAAVYAGIVFSAQIFLQSYVTVPQWALILLAAIAIAVGFKPLEEFITLATDKIFFKKKFDYQKALRDISGAMVHLTTMDRLVDLITRIAVKTMRLEGGLAMVLSEKTQRYVVMAAVKNVVELQGVSISDNYILIEMLKNTQDIIVKDEIISQLGAAELTEEEKNRLLQIREDMDKFKAAVLVPTFSKGKHMGRKLIGVLSLGEKKSQDAFSNEDLDLLRTLSNQASVALENAILYDEQVKSREMLLKTEKMAALGTMAAGIVHELKNPLAFMQTVSQRMPQKWDDKDFKETTIKMLPEEVLRMKGIVDGLLEYSKQHALKLSPINLKEVVEGVLAVVAYEVRKNSVEVKKEIPEALPLVMGDKNCLMQILLNLVNNSIQAMRRGGTLNIKLEDLGARVVMKVTDSGIGIPKERIKDIFNPFYTTKDIGTGLGLAITQKLVEEHKGTIDVSSIVGQGTTFAVYLPVATAT